ncbi:IspD/TarI family cytidylyltransferase, partial [Klebsiella oxytoca]|uniref:IspD/TarI family cytidylyltransferase n=1 Tax=Klebsiella oxytoca TaxID=571 RepID=UPI0034DAC730
INNGVNFLKEHSNPEDTIVIHDGIRPLVDELVLSDVIVKCQEYGNAVTSLPYNEQIFVKETEETTRQYINRETLRRVSTPQSYKFEKLNCAYEKALRENIAISE